MTVRERLAYIRRKSHTSAMPVLVTGGRVELMTLSPAALASKAADAILPGRIRDDQRERQAAKRRAIEAQRIKSSEDDLDLTCEETVSWMVTENFDVIVRNYNPEYSIEDLEPAEILAIVLGDPEIREQVLEYLQDIYGREVFEACLGMEV